MKRTSVILLMLVSFAAPVAADEVHLTNGQMLDGLVLRESETQLVLQVAWEGHIVLDRSTIARVDASSQAERRALLDRWVTEHEAFKAREERERDFEEEQRAKGLILYRGEWVTKEELNAIKAEAKSLEEERVKRETAEKEVKRETESRKKLEGELATLTDRMASMQEEQARLQQEISSLRYLLARRYDHQRPRYPRLPRYFRDHNGQQFPVKALDDRTFIQLPDGTQCDLDAVSGGGYRYRDPAGIWHDVQPVVNP